MTSNPLEEVFREKAYELLAELEDSLLRLEERPDDMELIGRAFRAMHTIKGSGGMFGFDNISRFTHEVETVFDMVRNGKLAVSKHIIDLLLAAHDQIRKMLDAPGNGDFADEIERSDIVACLKNIAPRGVRDTQEVS